MGCYHAMVAEVGCDPAFTIDASRVTFGRGALDEVGPRVGATGARRVALFTDARVASLPFFDVAKRSLAAAGLDVVVYSRVRVEPTDASLREAIAFATEVRADAYVSVGGGSVIDTCKAANLYATHPAPFDAYVNAPLGGGRAPAGPLAPHVACPTTSGTGSEVTGIAVFDHTSAGVKTGIACRELRPSEALVDPRATETLPRMVVAASGVDVLCHALESFTARASTSRPRPASPALRPMSQGRNPHSDLGCREALRLLGDYLLRAARDASDFEAREATMWAATLAGIAFGNAGVHLPHAMSYAVAGLAHKTGYRAPGYPEDGEPFVPHGISVMVNAPSVFRATGATSAARHLEAAALLGADVRGAGDSDAGEVLASRLVELMRALDLPIGLGVIGYQRGDVAALAAGAAAQARLVSNAPIAAPVAVLEGLFEGALAYELR
ncbi:MAG: hydroxyacid-oxoacid transhydrogenase [Polyangiaceae bacterium]